MARALQNSSVRLVLSGILMALFIAAWRGQHAFQFGSPRAPGGWLLAASLTVLVALAALARRLTEAGNAAAPERPLSARAERVAVAALLLLGVFYRVVHFFSVPSGMNHDAAWNGMYAIYVRGGVEYTPYVSAAWGRETFFSYLTAAFLPFWGNTPELLQFTATLCGVAALLCFYPLARAVVGQRAGLLALGFLAVSGWHEVFSRVGWRVVAVPPFEILALYACWLGFQTKRFGYWMLLGAACGASLNTYNAARIVPPMMAALFLLLVLWQRKEWKQWLVGAAAALICFLVVGGPMLWYAVNNYEKWQSRAEHLATYYNVGSRLLSNAISALAIFNYRGNGNDFFVNEPVLEPMAAVLFVLGVVAALRGIRRREHQFLTLGFFLSLLPGILSLPNGNRCLTALPFVYLFIAVGLRELVATCGGLVHSAIRRKRLTVALIAAPLLVSALETYDQFLGAERRELYGTSESATAAGEFMRDYMATHKVYTISGLWPEYTLTFLSYDGAGYPLEPQFVYAQSFAQVEPEIDRFGAKGLLFVLGEDREGVEALERLKRMFAEHRIEPVTARRAGGRQVATALIVEPSALTKSQPWSNTSRSLFVHGAPDGSAKAGGTVCFEPVGSSSGLSSRVQLMVPEVGDPVNVGEVMWLADCPPAGEAGHLLSLVVGPDGLVAKADHAETLVPWRELESGHWYEVHARMSAQSREVEIFTDGRLLQAQSPLFLPAGAVARVDGLQLRGRQANDPAGHFYLDNLGAVGALVPPGDPVWGRDPSEHADLFVETFESRPFGPLAEMGGWRDIEGTLTVAGGPSYWHAGGTSDASGANAFDGVQGDGPGQFHEPVGLAVSPKGNVYVADRLNHRIQKFTADGAYVTEWGTLGEGPGQFREPHDVAADDQFVYVADTWNQRVQVFDPNGNFIFEIRDKPPLSSPRGIFARRERIYLADSGNGVGRVFDRSGQLLATLGEKDGSGPGHLSEPVDLVADREGKVYILNSGNNRIEIFASGGEVVGSFPIPGWTGSGLKESYLAIDGRDVIYMSDWESGRVRRFKTDGTELTPVGPRSNQPCGVGVVGGRLIVAARAEHRLKGALLDGPPGP